MYMPKISEWIAVGEVSAERDDNLVHYFYDAGVSKNLVNNKKQYLLLGRKGAGKTAVYLNMLRKSSDVFRADDLIVGMSLQSYNWQAHDLLINGLKAGGFQHRDSWRFVLCVESVRALSDFYAKEGLVLPNPLKRAKVVLEKLFDGPIPTWTQMLGSKLFGLANAKLPEFGVGDDGLTASGGEISFQEMKADESLKAKLNRNIENLTAWLERTLESCPENRRVFLIFDRLDEAWTANFVEQSKSIISGLLHASEHILEKFDGKIRPIVFLREDIFSTFDINDRNKLKEDCSESLRWTYAEIEKLVLKRINYYAGLAGYAQMSALQDIFADKEMRSRMSPPKHIFNRTMGRPRDMVAFLGRTFKAAKEEDFFNVDTGGVLSKAIYAAEPGYSEYLYGELSDEWRSQKANFHDYLDVLENLRYATITTLELETALTGKRLVSDRAEFRTIVRFLFENSIIGITVGDSKQWRYRCFYPTQAFVDGDVIKVHPGLIKRLGLTEGSSDAAAATGKVEGESTDQGILPLE
jgi:hypothetical protein